MSMIQIKYVDTQHSNWHHRRQMDIADHHIYSMQLVSLFCGCESFVFQHEQTCWRIFRCVGKREAKASSSRSNQ